MEPVGGNHEPEAAARGRSWLCTAETFPVRACGMEARGLPQHRTQVKPRKAGLSGQACFATRRPISNRGRTVLVLRLDGPTMLAYRVWRRIWAKVKEKVRTADPRTRWRTSRRPTGPHRQRQGFG
jgi:hypothetical protein